MTSISSPAQTRRPTEDVLGSDLRIGDIIRLQGYRWTITAIRCEEYRDTVRYLADIEAADQAEAASLGGYATMTAGLIIGHFWSREIAA